MQDAYSGSDSDATESEPLKNQIHRVESGSSRMYILHALKKPVLTLFISLNLLYYALYMVAGGFSFWLILIFAIWGLGHAVSALDITLQTLHVHWTRDRGANLIYDEFTSMLTYETRWGIQQFNALELASIEYITFPENLFSYFFLSPTLGILRYQFRTGQQLEYTWLLTDGYLQVHTRFNGHTRVPVKDVYSWNLIPVKINSRASSTHPARKEKASDS